MCRAGKNSYLCGDLCSLYSFVGYKIQEFSKKCFSPQINPVAKKAMRVYEPQIKQPVCPRSHGQKPTNRTHYFYFGELYLLYVMLAAPLSDSSDSQPYSNPG